MELSIIIPCFNEEKIIQETVEKVYRFCSENLNKKLSSFEIIPVNDGSSDNSKSILDSLKSDIVKPYHFSFNKGRGAAMKKGIQCSTKKYIMFLDADLSYDVEHIEQVVDKFIEQPNLGMIILSPYMNGGIAKNIPFSRLLLSKTANWILSGFFTKKISTVTSMVRAYRRDVIKDVPLLLDGKELHLEILKKMVLKGAPILEIPGRLVWKDKSRAGRLNKKKIADSAFKHLGYAFFSRPNRILSKFAFILLLFSIYEFSLLLYNLYHAFQYQQSFAYSLWLSLGKVFAHSPHSVVLAMVSLILSVQFFSFYVLFNLIKAQNEESSAHLLYLIEKINSEKK